MLSGRTHELLTAVAIVHDDQIHEHVDVTRLTMRPLSMEEIKRLCRRGQADRLRGGVQTGIARNYSLRSDRIRGPDGDRRTAADRVDDHFEKSRISGSVSPCPGCVEPLQCGPREGATGGVTSRLDFVRFSGRTGMQPTDARALSDDEHARLAAHVMRRQAALSLKVAFVFPEPGSRSAVIELLCSGTDELPDRRLHGHVAVPGGLVLSDHRRPLVLLRPALRPD